MISVPLKSLLIRGLAFVTLIKNKVAKAIPLIRIDFRGTEIIKYY
jgi:hypothetical protein